MAARRPQQPRLETSTAEPASEAACAALSAYRLPMPDQVAFVVMPFRRKPTGRTEKHVPAEVDFDALWERVYQPVLRGPRLPGSARRSRRRRADHHPDDPAAGHRRRRRRRHHAGQRERLLRDRDPARGQETRLRAHRGRLGAARLRPRPDASAPVPADRRHVQGRQGREGSGGRAPDRPHGPRAGVSPVFDAVPGFPDSDSAAGVRVRGRFWRSCPRSRPTPGRSAPRPSRTVRRGFARCWRSTASGRRPARPWPSSCCDWFATSWVGRTS